VPGCMGLLKVIVTLDVVMDMLVEPFAGFILVMFSDWVLLEGSELFTGDVEFISSCVIRVPLSEFVVLLLFAAAAVFNPIENITAIPKNSKPICNNFFVYLLFIILFKSFINVFYLFTRYFEI
jgi:hypothetical protein